jgi:hypothetical protein
MTPDGTITKNLLISVSLEPYGWSTDGRWLAVRKDGIIQLVEVATGMVLPLPYSGPYSNPSWQR